MFRCASSTGRSSSLSRAASIAPAARCGVALELVSNPAVEARSSCLSRACNAPPIVRPVADRPWVVVTPALVDSAPLACSRQRQSSEAMCFTLRASSIISISNCSRNAVKKPASACSWFVRLVARRMRRSNDDGSHRARQRSSRDSRIRDSRCTNRRDAMPSRRVRILELVRSRIVT